MDGCFTAVVVVGGFVVAENKSDSVRSFHVIAIGVLIRIIEDAAS